MENVQLNQKVLEELSDIAFANAGDYFIVEEGVLKIRSSEQLGKKQLSAVASMEKSTGGIKVKFYDKLKALELLGKYLGLFDGRGEPAQQDNGLLTALREQTKIEVDIHEISEIQ